MNTKTLTQIGMREFLRNMKDVKTSVLNGQEFEVLDHARPVFRVISAVPTAKKKYSFADLSKLQFAGVNKTVAQNVDTVVYGN
jgi:antitoxin (DNA-binding transcriptional repressor) of toxin-antitoxin stability system